MSVNRILLRASLALTLLSPAVRAQLGNAWVTFAPDNTRIRTSTGAVNTSINGDPQEKDMAWGDLDKDGWTDLVIVRKQPNTTTGAFPNYLLMNEGGLLVDRSAAYADASDVPGDHGFQTPTNDRDVVLVDVNLDSWLDVVTATTLADGQPKHISHPRVYMNLGDDANGRWLGLRFENNRMPTFSQAPHFCAVAAGDVTGDGYPDLYFADYGDLSDKLLINDGTGFFTDSFNTRMSVTMLDAAFGSAARIVDMNMDGLRDIVRSSGLTGNGAGPLVSVAYNKPGNVGHFELFQQDVANSTPYHVDVGDLNNDGRPDIIVSDDGPDNYRYNTGTDPTGRVTWGARKNYQFLTGGDDGFGGTNLIVDIDGDGWNDAIHTDVDVDVGGCNRRCHIFHNPGGAIGGDIQLREEAAQSPGTWRGVVGLSDSDLTGTFDVAVFDIDNDGDKDMVIGRCTGTFVWINQATGCPSIGYEYGIANTNSTGNWSHISSSGSTSMSANNLVLTATGVPPTTNGLFFYGPTRLFTPAPFGNGLRWVNGSLVRLPVAQSNALGITTFACNFNVFPMNGLVPGNVRQFQLWYRDPAGGGPGYNASNALEFTICP